MLDTNVEKIIEQDELIVSSFNSPSIALKNYDGGVVFAKISDFTPAAKSFQNSNVNSATNVITMNDHSMVAGLKVRLTTNGLLPTGLLLNTDYYVIVVDANKIQLASDFANFLVGTGIDFTTIGTGTGNVVPVALSGAIKLQMSLDNVDFADCDSSNKTFSSSTNLRWNMDRLYDLVLRANIAVNSGAVKLAISFKGKQQWR